jgi:hypothetical protein
MIYANESFCYEPEIIDHPLHSETCEIHEPSWHHHCPKDGRRSDIAHRYMTSDYRYEIPHFLKPPRNERRGPEVAAVKNQPQLHPVLLAEDAPRNVPINEICITQPMPPKRTP